MGERHLPDTRFFLCSGIDVNPMALKLLRAVSTGTELADVINETQSAELNMKNEIKHILRARVGADVEVQPVIPGMCPVSV